MDPFQRHIALCNTTPLPPGLVPFIIGGAVVGWLLPPIVAALRDAGAPIEASNAGWALADTAAGPTAAMAGLAALLAARGLVTLRAEPFDIRATPAGPVLATLDRGALPAFGIAAAGVHLNGLVRRPDGLHAWVGVRAASKPVAPGKLDNIVAGGIPAGLDAATTLVKEAAEEASLPVALARQARPVGLIRYVMATEGGLRRDTLHCFDLELPADITPRPNDGEVARFELWPVARLFEAVRDTDAVKFNVNLVLIDLFLRQGLIDPGSAEGMALRAGLAGPLTQPLA